MIEFEPHSEKQERALFSKKRIILLASGIQFGKGIPEDEYILTDSGYKLVKDITYNDTLFDRNGEKTKIIGIYPQGLKECYRIKFKRGGELICDESHLNIVIDPHGRKERILSTAELYEKKCYWEGRENKNSASFPSIKSPIDFSLKEILFSPYVIGAFISNGSITSNIGISTNDKEVIERLSDEFGEKFELRHVEGCDYSLKHRVRKTNNKGYPVNDFKDYLEEVGLYGKHSYEKFIPDAYKYNSIENRIALLHGLMDGDGHVTKANPSGGNSGRCVEYSTTSERLANDVVFLVESLGGRAWVRSKMPTYKYNGEKRTGRRIYSISMNCPVNTFYLKRKSDLYFKSIRTTNKAIETIEPIGKKSTICFAVDSETKTFIARDQVVTHNTSVGAVWLRVQIHRHPSKHDNFIVTAPTYKILKQSSLPAFLNIMGNLGKYNAKDDTYRIPNGPTIYFRTNTEPDSVVGITNVRGIWCDEAGKYSLYFWENIQARSSFKACPIILTTSPYSLNWVYKELIASVQKGKRLDEIELIQAASYENPYFPREEYERKKATMDERRFNMVYGGQWLRQEGLVYDVFNEEDMVINPYNLPTGTIYYGGIDWGYRDPFVVIIRAITPYGFKIDISEFYKSNLRPSQIKEIVSQKQIVFGVKMFYADPSRPDLIQELQVAGIPIMAAKNDIQEGIDKHYELMKGGHYRIFRGTCPNLIDEYDSYHYSEEVDLLPDQNMPKNRDVPVDQNNHACDAVRYLSIMTEGKENVLSPRMPGPKHLGTHPTDVFKRKLRVANDL